MGDQPGAFAILSLKESIGAAIVTSAAPHFEEFGDLRAVGTFEGLRAFGTFKGLRAFGTFEELGGT